jgi:hypothetical protein
MNKLFTILSQAGILVLTLISLSACETMIVQGGGGGVYVDPYRRAWYDVYGNQCTSYGYPMAGCNFYADGSKITAQSDPYFASRTLFFDYWTYTDSYGYRRDYMGYAWLSSTGILYDSMGNALNEMEDGADQSADLITAAAEQEEVSSRAAGRALSEKYALAESAGVSIAKTLQDWAVLGRERSRTQADVAEFSKRLYGVELSRAASAVKEAAKGNRQALSEINIDVAAHWGTSPETSKEILSQWYKDELARLGGK